MATTSDQPPVWNYFRNYSSLNGLDRNVLDSLGLFKDQVNTCTTYCSSDETEELVPVSTCITNEVKVNPEELMLASIVPALMPSIAGLSEVPASSEAIGFLQDELVEYYSLTNKCFLNAKIATVEPDGSYLVDVVGKRIQTTTDKLRQRQSTEAEAENPETARSTTTNNSEWHTGLCGRLWREKGGIEAEAETPAMVKGTTTNFIEWRRELLYGCAYEGLESALEIAKAKGKTALCIWFHGLTGKGADFEVGLQARIAHQLPWVEWYCPDAPGRPVTSYDGKVEPCWFDQLQMPVTESMATPGLEVSVCMVHELLRQAEAHGFPSNRIMLGGMSQGGVLAMTAGFCYAERLAGIMAVSAWVPRCLHGAMRQPCTPLMYANGDQDHIVPMSLFQKGFETLARAGCNQIATKVYPGLCHTWLFSECEDIQRFIHSVAPNQTHN
jgi:predicted esterase